MVNSGETPISVDLAARWLWGRGNTDVGAPIKESAPAASLVPADRARRWSGDRVVLIAAGLGRE